MKVEIRRTISGTEYWDTENKRTLFVPKGEKPDFEVAEDPGSMITEPDEEKEVKIEGQMHLEDMTVKQLHAFAKQIEVEIPSDIKKKEDIVNFLIESKQ